MTTDSSTSGIVVDSFEAINDHFTELEMLGEHGHYVLARAKRYGRWSMLKALAPAESQQMAYRELLVKEFEIMSRLQHPGVVEAKSLEDVPGLGRCIVMEWVNGATLKEWLSAGSHSRDERRQVAHQLMDALSHIHSQGVVHRDIKPSNIMVTNTGQSVKVIDFGLADTDAHTTLKQPAGTVSYMAPEQATASQPDVRNDIYSLGMVLKQMDLGGLYRRPIARCLLPINERYPSVDELQADLRHRATRRRIAAIAGAATLLLSLAVGCTYVLARTGHTTDTATSQRVDSLHQLLEETSTVVGDAMREQDSLVRRLKGLNDSLASLNMANGELRQQQAERDARQHLVDEAIAEGCRRIDATNAATHLREHLDTLSRGDYVWVDWNRLSREGRIVAMPKYMLEIRSRFTSKELSEIEYALTEHCTHYEVTIQQRIHAKKVFIYYENSIIEGD